VLARLRDEIRAQQGWISFARYMELVLYEPGLGYYAGGARKFGASGDFVTAPELGSLFGRTFARQLKALAYPVLEFGAGSGALAATLLSEHDFDYRIVEPSPDLRARQQARLGARVQWLDPLLNPLPERIRGVVIANEVLDAMPVHALAWRSRGIMERGVTLSGDGLAWSERPAQGELLEQAGALEVPLPYESEIGLIAQAWTRELARRLEEGVLFVIDYGFPRREYYHPQRSSGTLMCHHRHRAHADVFARPGAEDVTAHLDFTAIAGAAVEGGLDVLGYTTQAQFLVNCGITDVLGEANVENALHYAPLAAQAQKLLSPAEMGELFKVLAVGRGVRSPLLGFSRGDRAAAL
jgi:SAM-dependent MidA family methyltransferase